MPYRTYTRYVFSLLLLLGAGYTTYPVFGQAGARIADLNAQYPAYTVTPVATPFEVDGVLDEPGWETATVIPIHYEWLPGDNVEPPVATDALLTFDERNLYVAFRAQDPAPGQVRAHLMDRDALQTFVQDDHVGFIIDPFNDQRRSFQFRINPLGVQVDGIFSELDGVEDFSWDIIWDAAGRVTADGYVVEVAIPFNQLRFPNTDEVQTWGFEAFRSYPRNVRHRMASHYVDRNRSCVLCQLNKVEGFQNLSPGKNLEFNPTLTARRTDTREDVSTGTFEAGRVDPEFGLSGRWSLTPNLILNGTVNPDFSQVEADVAQLETNQRFALFFEEKRPFFLEGLDFFQTPLQAIFTRTITDPVAGVKTTGKVGHHALGVFLAQDRVNNLIIPSNQGSASAFADQGVSSGVVRYRRDVGRNSALGALYTGREAGDYRNHVAGVDGFVRLSRANTFTFQYLRSLTDYTEDLATTFGQASTSFGGNAFDVALNHGSRHWFINARYRDLSPGFREDSGFLPRVDFRTAQAGVTRRVWSRNQRAFTQINIGVNASRTIDYDGTLTDQRFRLNTFYNGPLQSVVVLNLLTQKERFLDTTYDLQNGDLFVSIQPTGAFSLTFSGLYGDAIDFANRQPATSLRLGPGFGVKIGRHVNWTMNYIMQRLAVAGEKLLTEQLVQTRLLYHFNVRTFIRATVQLRTINREVDRFTTPIAREQQTLFTQLLFSYKLNPQSVIFLGYSDNHLGAEQTSLTQLNRTLFLKLGYAWVL